MSGGGDTPTPNTFKYEFSPGGWIAGEIVDNGGEFKEALIYAQLENVARVYNADGVASGGYTINDTIKQKLADAIQETLQFQVDPVGQMEEPTAQGETVPNWDEYQIVKET